MSRPYTATVPPFKDDPRITITITQEDGRKKTRVVAEHMIYYLLEDHTRISAPGNVVDGIHADFDSMSKAEMLQWVDTHQSSDTAAHQQVRALMDKQTEEELRRTLNVMNPIQGATLPHPTIHFETMEREDLIHWLLTTGDPAADKTALEAVFRSQSLDQLREEAKLAFA